MTGLRRRLERRAERLLLRVLGRSRRPQLFVIGLPRSGTTLVYQYLVHRLEVAYFTQGVGEHPKTPCLTTWWQKTVHGPYVSDFRSHYGKSEGAASPREAWTFWSRFFDLDRYETHGDLPAAKARELRATIHCVQRVFGNRPFVAKQILLVTQLDALATLFPAARFLVTERALDDVAVSMLRMRYDLVDDPREWVSVRPPGWERLAGRPLPEQVCGQLLGTLEKLESDLARLPTERVLRLRYEDFCSAPEEAIREVRTELGDPPFRNPPVTSFERSRSVPRTEEEREVLRLLRERVGAAASGAES